MTSHQEDHPARAERVAIVTGAGGGLGSAVARLLAETRDYRLCLVDNRRDAVRTVADEVRALGADAEPLVVDLGSSEAAESVVPQTIARFGRVDALVNAAAILHRRDFDAVTPKDFDDVFHVNTLAPFLLARAAMSDMASRGWGRIVNVTSTGVYEGGFTMTSALYEASKGAVAVLTKMLSRHGAGDGILVNTVCPGGMRTGMLLERDVTGAGRQGRARDDPAPPDRRPGGDRPHGRVARQRPEHVCHRCRVRYHRRACASLIVGNEVAACHPSQRLRAFERSTMSAMPSRTWTARSRSTRRCWASRCSCARPWDVPYVGEIVGYPDLVLEGAFFQLPNGVILELLEYKSPTAGHRRHGVATTPGNAHLCLVTDDMAADFARLRAAGYDTFRSERPIDIPWGPYRGGRACYLRDPDGTSIELLEEPPGGPDWSA